VPVPTGDPPAPAAITNLVKCRCRKTNCRSHCSCRSQNLNLNCSEMCVCVCEADDEACSNVIQEVVGIDDDEDDGDPST